MRPDDPELIGVAGQIVDFESGRPMAGAQVFLRGTIKGTLADPRGIFWIPTPSEGDYHVQVRLIGYQEACVSVSLAPGVIPVMRIRVRRVRSRPRRDLDRGRPSIVLPAECVKAELDPEPSDSG